MENRSVAKEEKQTLRWRKMQRCVIGQILKRKKTMAEMERTAATAERASEIKTK